MAKRIDVSMDIFTGMTVWPGDEDVLLERTDSLEQGAAANVSRLRCSVHTGTHVDAPLHFIAGGFAVEQLPLETLCGPAWTASFVQAERITAELLAVAGIPEETKRLLLRTSNSEVVAESAPFLDRYVGLDAGAAEWIVRHGIRLVGIDYLSVAAPDQTGRVHQILLKENIILVEGLRLSEVPAGPCRFSCLPLKLVGSDGAPARAMVEAEQ
jgi:arylformamidase